jgi:hypothetical protein
MWLALQEIHFFSLQGFATTFDQKHSSCHPLRSLQTRREGISHPLTPAEISETCCIAYPFVGRVGMRCNNLSFCGKS